MDLNAIVAQLIAAVSSHNSLALCASLVVALTFLVRNYGARLGPDFEKLLKSDPGGVLMTFLSAFGVALGRGGTLDVATLLTAAKTALVAAGGYSVLLKLLKPVASAVLGKIFPLRSQAIVDSTDSAAALQAGANASKPAADSLSGIK